MSLVVALVLVLIFLVTLSVRRSDVHLSIGGTSSRHHPRYLRDLQERHGPHPAIAFLGYVPEAAVPGFRTLEREALRMRFDDWGNPRSLTQAIEAALDAPDAVRRSDLRANMDYRHRQRMDLVADRCLDLYDLAGAPLSSVVGWA